MSVSMVSYSWQLVACSLEFENLASWCLLLPNPSCLHFTTKLARSLNPGTTPPPRPASQPGQPASPASQPARTSSSQPSQPRQQASAANQPANQQASKPKSQQATKPASQQPAASQPASKQTSKLTSNRLEQGPAAKAKPVDNMHINEKHVNLNLYNYFPNNPTYQQET